MSNSNTNIRILEQELLDLREEIATLREKNEDLNERLKAHSLINTGQISLINKLIDKVPFGVMLIDEYDIIIHANVAAGNIFSIRSSLINGMNINNYFKSYKRLDIESVSENVDEIKLQQINCVNSDKYILHSAFVSDEGSKRVIVESFIDITEIKQAEQELVKLNKIKDEFLGMISHELRTPLNVIHGYSSLLEEELTSFDSADASVYVAKISSAGEMLLHVVNNLLELSNLTAGKIKADYIPIDLQMIVTQLEYRLESIFIDNSNKLIFKYEDIKPFEQDLALLMKILYELLLNANKFTEKGEVTLTIFLDKKDGIDWLCFKIFDTGCGMTEDTVKLIFTAFHQADASLTRSYEGLGLGLSIVEKMVNIINGYIEVESEISVGSTFKIFIPYKKIEIT